MRITSWKSQKIRKVAITFPAYGTVVTFFGVDSPGKLHRVNCSLVLGTYVVLDPSLLHGYETPEEIPWIALNPGQTLL